jgi:hypothetical protein
VLWLARRLLAQSIPDSLLIFIGALAVGLINRSLKLSMNLSSASTLTGTADQGLHNAPLAVDDPAWAARARGAMIMTPSADKTTLLESNDPPGEHAATLAPPDELTTSTTSDCLMDFGIGSIDWNYPDEAMAILDTTTLAGQSGRSSPSLFLDSLHSKPLSDQEMADFIEHIVDASPTDSESESCASSTAQLDQLHLYSDSEASVSSTPSQETGSPINSPPQSIHERWPYRNSKVTQKPASPPHLNLGKSYTYASKSLDSQQLSLQQMAKRAQQVQQRMMIEKRTTQLERDVKALRAQQSSSFLLIVRSV